VWVVSCRFWLLYPWTKIPWHSINIHRSRNNVGEDKNPIATEILHLIVQSLDWNVWAPFSDNVWTRSNEYSSPKFLAMLTPTELCCYQVNQVMVCTACNRAARLIWSVHEWKTFMLVFIIVRLKPLCACLHSESFLIK